MRKEDSYQPRETALYLDEGGIDRVEILANTSDRKNITYRLKVLEVLRRRNPWAKQSKIGEEFDCFKVRGFSLPGPLWELEPDDKETSLDKFVSGN